MKMTASSFVRFTFAMGTCVFGLAAQDTLVDPPDTGAAVWRFSADQKAYSIRSVDGHLLINPIHAGAFSADLPIKVDKKGRESIMGQWQSGAKEGFILINGVSVNRVSAVVLVPLDDSQPNACMTRMGAILANIASANAHKIVCGNLAINWLRDASQTPEQASQMEANLEQAQAYAAAVQAASGYVSQGQPGNGPPVDAGLIGTWERRSGDRYNPLHIVITLNPDGSYDKTWDARMGGMGVGNLAGSEHGTWHSSGSIIYTASETAHTQNQFDMRTFQRIR